MLQLIKRDWLHTWGILLAFALLVPIFALLKLTFTYILLYSFITICLYTNHEQKVNRYLVSLPIKRNVLVLSRYAFVFLVCMCLLLYTFVMEFIKTSTLYTPLIYILGFAVISLAIAVSLPLYYFFQNIWWAFVSQLFVLIVCSLLFAFVMADPFDTFYDWMDPLITVLFMEPYMTFPALSFAVLAISYGISCFIFNRKDLA